MHASGASLLGRVETLLRLLIAHTDRWPPRLPLVCSRASLRVLGSVGEPINPEAWKWYHEVRPEWSVATLSCYPSAAACLVTAGRGQLNSRAQLLPSVHMAPMKVAPASALIPPPSPQLNRWLATAAAPLWTPGGRRRLRAT